MLPLRQLFASLLLTSSAQAYVYLDSWMWPNPPTNSDTFVAVETSTMNHISPHSFTWIVEEHDARSRPLSASYTIRSSEDDHRITIDYRWDFDLDFPATPFASRCPSRFVVNNSGSPAAKSDTNWFAWDPAARTLLGRSNNGMQAWPDCPWSDSIILDTRNRVSFQATCGKVSEAFPDTAPHLQYVRYWYEDTSSHPRSASSRVPDLPNWLDTLSVVGPIQRPYAAKLVHTDSTGSTTTIDSLEWNSRGQRTRRVSRKGYRTSVYTDEFDGDRLVRHSSRYWQGDSLVDSLLDVYRYTLAGTGVSHRTSSRQLARIVSTNGLPRLEIDLSAPEHIRVERLSLAGKRLALLADRNLPAGRTLLPISVQAGELVRIESASVKTILVAPPR